MANHIHTVEDALHRLEEFAAMLAFLVRMAGQAGEDLSPEVCNGTYEVCEDMQRMARSVFERLSASNVAALGLDLVEGENEDDEDDKDEHTGDDDPAINGTPGSTPRRPRRAGRA